MKWNNFGRKWSCLVISNIWKGGGGGGGGVRFLNLTQISENLGGLIGRNAGLIESLTIVS